MKIKLIYLTTILLFEIQSDFGNSIVNDFDYIKASILSNEFAEFYNFCEINSSNFTIYNETGIANNSKVRKCNKKINIKKINFKYDLNIPTNPNNPLPERKIILYKFEKNEKNVKLYYVSIPDNKSLIFEYNDKCELINIIWGAF